jgi:hypothetical protein
VVPIPRNVLEAALANLVPGTSSESELRTCLYLHLRTTRHAEPSLVSTRIRLLQDIWYQLPKISFAEQRVAQAIQEVLADVA